MLDVECGRHNAWYLVLGVVYIAMFYQRQTNSAYGLACTRNSMNV